MGRSVPPTGAPTAALSRWWRLWPLVVLVIALSMRLWGIGWQLPYALYFDELKYVSWAGEAKDDAGAAVSDLRNPSLFHHLLQAEYAVASLVRNESTRQATAVFELRLARLTSATLGALACVLVALAASTLVRAVGGLRILPERLPVCPADDAVLAGLAAGLLLALSPLHVHLSHYAVNDATASLFLAAALLFGVRALTGDQRPELALAGLASGLAFSTKYSFAVGLLLPLVVAICARPKAATSTPTSESVVHEPGVSSLSRQPGQEWVRGDDRRVTHAALSVGIVLASFLVGMLAGTPEIVLEPQSVVAGIVEQARLGGSRWNGQSEDPIWQLYAETLVHGFGWPALLAAGVGAVCLALRRPLALLAVVAVPVICLGVMLRQELFFARFALPLLPPLAMLAGAGSVGLARFGVGGLRARPGWIVALALIAVALQLLPQALTTVRHNQLAVTTDTRVQARSWLRQRGDGARVATEVYGQPLLWAGSQTPRGYRLVRVGSFVEASTIGRLVCDDTRYFITASLTAERELARRGSKRQESGYALLAREGQVVAVFDPFVPGMSAPAHPDNTGIPFWFLEAYARPGPKIIVYELSSERFSCAGNRSSRP